MTVTVYKSGMTWKVEHDGVPVLIVPSDTITCLRPSKEIYEKFQAKLPLNICTVNTVEMNDLINAEISDDINAIKDDVNILSSAFGKGYLDTTERLVKSLKQTTKVLNHLIEARKEIMSI